MDQALIQAQMAAIADRSRTVFGRPTSLADLGYVDVGLDDNWQQCGSYGPSGFTFHTEEGRPVVRAWGERRMLERAAKRRAPQP